MSPEHDPNDPCAGDATGAPGCLFVPLERLRFWNGRFLVARDLRHQQDDLFRRLEYHQRFAHGEGILCGFGIRRHPRDECERDWLVVDPGMACDCCGRTLWMTEPRTVRIPSAGGDAGGAGNGGVAAYRDEGAGGPPGGWNGEPPAGEAGRDADGEEWDAAGGAAEEGGGERARAAAVPPHAGREPGRAPDPEWFVVARRVERPTDPQPALYADDLSEPVRHQHGRVREEVELRVVPAGEVPDECWPRWRPVTEADCEDEVDDDDCRRGRGDTVPCEHRCACGDGVVLAGVRRDRQGRLRWDLTHRRVLVPPAGLTRITGISWPHGGEVSLARLRKREGRLVVRFSRPLRPAEGLARGINAITFEVAYLGQGGAWEQIVFDERDAGHDPPPRLSKNRRCAVFTLPDRFLGGRHNLAGSLVRVRLLCDFILDCHGRAVSGAHLGGDANGRGTGNGVPGGVFESWFYVRHSRKEEQ